MFCPSPARHFLTNLNHRHFKLMCNSPLYQDSTGKKMAVYIWHHKGDLGLSFSLALSRSLWIHEWWIFKALDKNSWMYIKWHSGRTANVISGSYATNVFFFSLYSGVIMVIIFDIKTRSSCRLSLTEHPDIQHKFAIFNKLTRDRIYLRYMNQRYFWLSWQINQVRMFTIFLKVTRVFLFFLSFLTK